MAADPYKYFRIEAHELVGELAKGVAELGRGGDMSKLLRAAHTLKGAARIVRHTAIAELAHQLETVLGPIRDAPVASPEAAAIVDKMSAELASLEADPAPAKADAPIVAEPAFVATVPRVETSALDEAIAGLQAVHALVGRARASRDAGQVARYLEQADRELREVRRDVEHLRLSSFGSLYAALERTVRDATAATGKRAAFVLDGADVRVDGAVLTALHGALVQLVRNAIAHGIESPARRAAVGKPAEGRVTIAARALGARIEVTCSDDGAGLDVAAIARAARIAGLLDATAAFQLLLRGGISTSREVTELSGRGIGLDVVRAAVDSLGGEVGATTSPAGTSVALRVPVSATAVPLLDVDAGGRTVAIPRAAVRRVGRVVATDMVATPDGSRLRFGDRTLPCAPLAALLGKSVGAGGTLVIVDGGDGLAAIVVDRALGIADQVVRALPAGAPIDPIVWGMVLDAEGQPYPVVDPRAVVAAAERARASEAVAAAQVATKLPILVVDDSLTTRMLEQTILESAGYEVHLAASAEEALDKLLVQPYALMLADVEMPGMDGFTLIGELRSRPTLASLPAVLVTSRDAEADRRRGAEVGAHGYIVKSRFDQNEVLALIARLIR
jgi:two-component system, chemotaxis family, sensor kinase CheA